MNRQDARNAKGLREPASEVDAVASVVLEAAVEVHRVLGPGFFEGVYEQALGLELTLRCVPFVRQPAMAIAYKDHPVGDVRPDLLVAQRLVIELKTVDRLAPIHLAQALSYLKATQLPLALHQLQRARLASRRALRRPLHPSISLTSLTLASPASWRFSFHRV